jgi:hypothetical protein
MGYASAARVAGFVLLGLLTGCASSRPQKVEVQKPPAMGRPVLDFSRGAGGLPLVGEGTPTSAGDLLSRLRAGYALRVDMPGGVDPVQAVGTWPKLESLRVDLSNGNVKGDYKPREEKKPGQLRPAFQVGQFQYVAEPLVYQNGGTRWNMWATDATFFILKANDAVETLVLADAKEGGLKFGMRTADVKPMLLAGARQHAKGGFWVKDLQFNATESDDGHTVEASMRVEALWLLVPTTFTMSGRASVDENCYLHLSNMTCRGEDVGGEIVAGFVNKSLAKHEGKMMPLAVWPGDRIALKDVRLRVGEEIRLEVLFAGRGADTK